MRDSLGTSGAISPNRLKSAMTSLDSVIKKALQEEQAEFSSKQVRQLKSHAQKTISSKIFTECLAADTRYAEFHIDLSENDNKVEIIQSGVIHLLYRHNEIWKIVDYKTDKIDSKKHLKELTGFYQDQLEGYVRAFAGIAGEQVTGELLFVDG